MNKKIAAIIVVIIVAIGGGMAYLLVNSSEEAPQEAAVPSLQTDQVAATEEAPQEAATAQPGTYVDYTSTALAEAAGTKVLFFHAPWCPQCRDLEADITGSQIPNGVTIFKVDYDTNQALRQQYGVTIQTTVVLVDDEGNLVRKFVAYDDPSLNAVKENLL